VWVRGSCFFGEGRIKNLGLKIYRWADKSFFMEKAAGLLRFTAP
jgi:hypothetical protein